MSPITTPSMLQNQLDKMQQKKEEDRRNVPSRNQMEQQVPMTPSFDRRNSYTAADNIKSRLVNKVKTPTFGELQYRFGKDAKSPSPVLDKDYQKEARQTVVGELSRYEMSSCFCHSGHLKMCYISATVAISKHPGFLDEGSRVSLQA